MLFGKLFNDKVFLREKNTNNHLDEFLKKIINSVTLFFSKISKTRRV